AKKTPGPEYLEPKAISGDHGLMLEERGAYGVIASITPSTNPVATVINNSITMLSAGNTVVFGFHPNAKNCCIKMVSILNDAIISVGGPGNLINTIENPSMEASTELMRHEDVKLVCVTGGPGVVKVAFSCGKKVIAAGPGNPPVVIDETADLDKAAKDVVNGASFDNNIMCIAEKECIILNPVFDKVREKMKQHGAFELKGEEITKVMKVVFDSNGQLIRKWCGKDAKVILKEIGIHVSDEIKLIIAEVDRNHPFVEEEMLMPILPLVRASNIDEAIDIAIVAEHGYFHTAMMHSHSIENLHKMASRINTTIFVKNGPSFSGLGFNGEGHTTLTIAGPTGEGCTTPKSFTRERRCVLIDYFRIV
ncbi:MAG TPA: aldehyde dehydrogenase, partial [Candidatus Wallbacteria bacterium]|nr:aldehyde dehydrogenase [Candidatus Wallbacteria bacterium]